MNKEVLAKLKERMKGNRENMMERGYIKERGHRGMCAL